jgi:hypothetical protein
MNLSTFVRTSVNEISSRPAGQAKSAQISISIGRYALQLLPTNLAESFFAWSILPTRITLDCQASLPPFTVDFESFNSLA